MSLINAKLRENRILLFDGAVGTNLQRMGLKPGIAPEELNLTKPEMIKELHRGFVDVGIDFITTNTFGGNRLKLAESGLANQIIDINTAAVSLAREVASSDTAIASSIGPTGSLIEPLGMLSFDKAIEIFLEQARILQEAGADIIILETFTDIAELRAAAMAVAQLNIPFIANMSLDDDGRAVTGTSAAAFAITMTYLGPIALGLNCGKTPEDYPSAIEQIARYSHLPILAEPNAGIPYIKDICTIFPSKPDEAANIALKNIEAGARFIGGCCGTTPEHIKEIARAIEGIERPKGQKTTLFFASSRTDALIIGDGNTKIIGERINPAGKKKLKSELRDGKLTRLRFEALRQEKAGTDAIDVNIAVPKMDEYPILPEIIMSLGNVIRKCIFIDSSNRKALDESMKIYNGRIVLNSITAKRIDLDELLPIVAKYGSAFIALPLDEEGIPHNAAGRLYLAKKIRDRAADFGITQDRILFDVLVMPIGSNSEYGKITLETLSLFKKEGFYCTAGVSNVSYGLPAREKLNASFLEHLVAGGIDSAIADPTIAATKEIVCMGNLLRGLDDNSVNYIKRFSDFQIDNTEKDIETTLYEDIERGDKDNAISKLQQLIEQNNNAIDIVNEHLIPAIRKVGDRFGRKEIFLPIVISSAETVKHCMDYLKPYLDDGQGKAKTKILLATVEGDIHDIGKNLVATVLGSYGFEVIDLGKSVSSKSILESIEIHKPTAIGLSALMTTTMPAMEVICRDVNGRYPNLPIVVGGACIDDDFAQKIGASAFAKDAIDAARIFEKLVDRKLG